MPGMPEWVPITDIPGIEYSQPPPLPKTALPPALPASATLPKSKKISVKSIIAFLLVLLGVLATIGGTGFGLILVFSGMIVGWLASNDFKSNRSGVGGKGWLTAARVIVLLFFGFFLIIVLTIAIPAVGSALSKAKTNKAESTKSIVGSPVKSENEASIPSIPQKQQTFTGRVLPYTISAPSDWKVDYDKGHFDIRLSSKVYYIGIIAEDAVAGTPQEVAEIVQTNFSAQASEASELTFSDTSEIVISGKKWIVFTGKGRVNKIPVGYLFCVTSTDSATYQMVGWTTLGLFEREQDNLYNIMKTFTFPK